MNGTNERPRVVGSASVRLRPRAAALLLSLLFASRLAANDGTDATSWWLRLRTTGYAFQTETRSGATQDRLGAYQQIDGAISGLANGRLSMHVSGRVHDDISLSEKINDRARLSSGYLSARITPRLSARLGRQFVQEGVSGLTLDGLAVSFSPAEALRARVYGGARAPIVLAYRDRVGDFGDDPVLGARLSYDPSPRLRSSLSFAYLEKDDRVSARPVGLEAAARPILGLRATGRFAYDLEGERWTRAETVLQMQRNPGCPVLTAQFVDRYPSIDAGSYFARFTGVHRSRLARGSIRYEHRNKFGGEIDYSGARVDDRTSARIGGAVLFPVGRAGYSARIGDAGEESRWFGDVRFAPLPWLMLEGGATILTYALFENAPEAEEREVTTAFGRIRVVPRSGTALLVEIQSLETPLEEEDVRVLAGLDLTMGRGTGAFGLSRGGWLR
ncbi:MAG: hypothetical protein FJY73_11195 [Candidatus Eisenbacteria bacterium]|nr:hypothetical protein [Candidatus Eisenbacteria bacterium]